MSVLPEWLRPVAQANPAAHVFEGMRSVISGGGLPWGHLAAAVGLNALYLALMIGVFYYTFAVCKERGSLVRVGE
jgi:ABC-2 type transport system permease protein